MQFYEVIEYIRSHKLEGFTSNEISYWIRIRPNHASVLLRRCYKMGFLRRKKSKLDRGGMQYIYWLSNWGQKYKRNIFASAEYKDFLLARFIDQYGSKYDKLWAREHLYPKLYRKVFRSIMSDIREMRLAHKMHGKDLLSNALNLAIDTKIKEALIKFLMKVHRNPYIPLDLVSEIRRQILEEIKNQ